MGKMVTVIKWISITTASKASKGTCLARDTLSTISAFPSSVYLLLTGRNALEKRTPF